MAYTSIWGWWKSRPITSVFPLAWNTSLENLRHCASSTSPIFNAQVEINNQQPNCSMEKEHDWRYLQEWQDMTSILKLQGNLSQKKSRSEKVFSNHRSAPWRQQDFQAEDPKEDPPRSESPSGSQWRMDLRRPLILVPVNYFYRGHPEKMDHNHMEKSKCW